MVEKQLVVAAESMAAPCPLQCRGGNWNLTFLVLPVMDLIGDFSVVSELDDLLKGELLNGVIASTGVLSAVAILH